MPAFAILTDALDAAAATAGGIHYIAGESSERRVAYAELRSRALGLLRYLQEAGAAPATQTIILVDGLAPFVDTFWACVLGRIVAVPLAPGNADEHKAKFFRVLARLPAATLATERKVFDRLRGYAAENGLADRLAKLERHTVFLDEISDVEAPGIEHRAAPDDVAFIQFSSGSTSEPKGVVLTHRNLATNIDAIGAGIGARADDTSLSWMPLTHDMGLIGFHLTPLFQGVDHWLMPTALFVRRPGLWPVKASEHRVSVTCSPNFGYQHYLKSHDPAKAANLDLSRIRIIFNGAEPIAADLCREFLSALAPARLAPNVMFPVYGLAEASLAVTFPAVGAPLAVETFARGALGPGDVVRTADPAAADAVEFVRVGTPVKGCELRIADEQGGPAPPGTVGRILIRGDNVSPRYFDDAELTAASRTADGFLDTGDLGTLRDGELVVTGRIKEILFVGGQNHYPQDIELTLATHAGIELGRSAAAGVRPPHAATDERAGVRAGQGRRRRAVRRRRAHRASRRQREDGARGVRRRPGAPVPEDDQRQDPALRARPRFRGRPLCRRAGRDREGRGGIRYRGVGAGRRHRAHAARDLPGGAAQSHPVARRQPVRDRHRLADARADLREGRGDLPRPPRGHRLLRVPHRAVDGRIPRGPDGVRQRA